jgi:hypothetical protein
MIPGIGLEAIIDIGFVILVVGLCGHNVFIATRSAEKRSKQFYQELRDLEKSLRSLIDQAATQSHQFEQSLGRKKHELEFLLRNLESIESSAKASGVINEFPNETWNRPNRPSRGMNEYTLGDEDNYTIELEQVANLQQDKINISRARTPKESKQVIADPRKARKTLNEKIQVSKNGIPIRRGPDPVPYRIARRLLASGQEIHVVARKLELPLSEVRLIDKLIRSGENEGFKPAKFYDQELQGAM